VPVLPPVQFEVGDRVSHDRHGLGRVVTVGRDEVVIDFGASRRRVQTSSSMLNKL
jgi:hypothetical protein